METMITKIRRIITTSLATLVLASGLSLTLVHPASALISDTEAKNQACQGVNLSSDGSSSCGAAGILKANDLLSKVINILSLIAGVVAVIMIIIGGVRYITSQGESASTAAAKNTIIYAIVGLVIVALAQIIVRFVLAKIK